jgi:hypothetical protein
MSSDLTWKDVVREGLSKILTHRQLIVLRDALIVDDPMLIQGATTSPPPLQCVEDWPVEAACPLGFCGWKGDQLDTVADVEDFFAKKCFELDQTLGEPAACRYFLNYWDDTPREEARKELLGEVEKLLEGIENEQRRSKEGEVDALEASS